MQERLTMDKIARLRQEIERRIEILTNVYAEQVERKDEEMMTYYHGKVIALEELLSFLDTLSEEPDKSLEEAAENSWAMYEYRDAGHLYSSVYKDADNRVEASDICYIRKDALLEWANSWLAFKRSGVVLDDGFSYAMEELIKKLNET